jgi:hypothetical protein
MIRTGIPLVSEAKQASARASGLRRNDLLRRLVRIDGDDAGVYTLAQVAERIGCTRQRAAVLVSATRRDADRQVTWAKLQRRNGTIAR